MQGKNRAQDHVPHARCRSPGPCIDEILNPPHVKHESDPVHRSSVVYRDRGELLRSSEVDDAEIRYLLSRARCRHIDRLEEGWRVFYEEVQAEPLFKQDQELVTKEYYLAWFGIDELNEIMRNHCPPHPNNGGKSKAIDRTREDDPPQRDNGGKIPVIDLTLDND